MSDTPQFLPMAARPEGPPPIFERIAIVGLGLIGGSIALAARERWPAALVIGVDRAEVLEHAVQVHAIDVAAEELMIVSEADLIILAAPVRANLAVLASLPEWVGGNAVVTDVGSTKRAIVEAARSLPERLRFIGGHPLAGAARGGIEYARADLFRQRPWLFTPDGERAGERGGGELEQLFAFVEALGGRPHTLPSAAAHDHLVALLSHLPQLTASALMAVIGGQVGEEGLSLAGRGLVDTTRLASSPPGIWRDVCATNADEIGPALDGLIDVLSRLRDDLASGDTIDAVFDEAARWREKLRT